MAGDRREVVSLHYEGDDVVEDMVALAVSTALMGLSQLVGRAAFLGALPSTVRLRVAGAEDKPFRLRTILEVSGSAGNVIPPLLGWTDTFLKSLRELLDVAGRGRGTAKVGPGGSRITI